MKKINNLVVRALSEAKKNSSGPDEYNNYANAWLFGYEAALEDAAKLIRKYEADQSSMGSKALAAIQRLADQEEEEKR